MTARGRGGVGSGSAHYLGAGGSLLTSTPYISTAVVKHICSMSEAGTPAITRSSVGMECGQMASWWG